MFKLGLPILDYLVFKKPIKQIFLTRTKQSKEAKKDSSKTINI